jgi:uncharacterized protein Yka (UPF0111/DUF47 family)
MTALQRFFGRDDKFYQLLETSAVEAQAGAGILVKLVAALNQSPLDEILRDLDLSRRKHKRVSQEITEGLCSTFATPLEREDIEELSTSLYKISKTIEKIGERLSICPPGLNMASITQQVALLEQGTTVLVKMVDELQHKRHGELIRDSYERIQAIEGDADRIMNELLRDLYHGQSEARVVVFWKDIYELLEKGIDRCRDSGSVLFHIVLKNS